MVKYVSDIGAYLAIICRCCSCLKAGADLSLYDENSYKDWPVDTMMMIGNLLSLIRTVPFKY